MNDRPTNQHEPDQATSPSPSGTRQSEGIAPTGFALTPTFSPRERELEPTLSPEENASEDVQEIRPHICLTGGWFSSRNIGDQAILLGMADALAPLGNPRYSVITANPDKIRAEQGWPAFAPKKTPRRLLTNLASADALVFTGGTPFYNAGPHMTYYAALARFAHARGIPVLVLGISLRTMGSSYCRFLLRKIVRWSALLGAREDRTLEAFRQIADPGKVCLVPDVATQLAPSAPERAREFLRREGVDASGPCVSICVRDFRAGRRFGRHHYSRTFDADALDNYRDAVLAAAVHAVRRRDCQVVFCPMNTVAPDDDRRLAGEIRDAIRDDGVRRRVFVMQQQHHPRDMKAMLGLMRANVGVRFHSLVLATSMGVPSLGIAYAHKNHAWMRFVGLDDYSHDLAEIDAELICAQLDELLLLREPIAARLRERAGRIDAQFAARLETIRGVLAERGPQAPLGTHEGPSQTPTNHPPETPARAA